jgi:flagellar protein FlaJ
VAENKKSKDVKDLRSWDDDLNKLISPKKGVKEPKNEDKEEAKSDSKQLDDLMSSKDKKLDISKREYIPSADELESEWEQKIKESKKSSKPIFDESATTKKRAGSLDEVFTQLKKKESTAPFIKSAVGKSEDRLDKIGGVVRGEVERVKERELTGVGVPGIYKLYPMGTLPPLNLLSKALSNFAGESLEKDLKKSNMPLYANEYVSFAVGIAFVFSICIFLMLFTLSGFNVDFTALVFPILAFILSLVLLAVFLASLPSLRVGSGKRGVDTQLPFALRHMSALLGAGISIFDSITSVSKAEYGALSTELDKVVWDVKSGENLTEALDDAADRINSPSFTRVTIHIRRALQMGGDVASIISQIADDLTFEMRMKVQDFVEKLNAFAIVYLIGGIVGPVVIAVFTVVSSAGPLRSMGSAGMMDSSMLMFMVLLIFPMMMIVITYVVKLMEPKV